MERNFDTRLVWHCNKRHTTDCKKHNYCRGDKCSNYVANPGSYNDRSLRKGVK